MALAALRVLWIRGSLDLKTPGERSRATGHRLGPSRHRSAWCWPPGPLGGMEARSISGRLSRVHNLGLVMIVVGS